MPESKEWYLCEKGFWKDEPYFILSEIFHYRKGEIILNQHVVIDEKENVDVYRFWAHTFSHGDIESLLAPMGFRCTECYDRILPDGDLCRSEDVTFCITTK